MRTSLRLPDELAEKIRERAVSERRSMHAMILLLLEQALAPKFVHEPGYSGSRKYLTENPPDSVERHDPHFKPDFKK